MTKQDVVNAAFEIWYVMRREWVPRDKGNMAFDALKFKVSGNVIHIEVDDAIAPYVPYTNEPWISPKWNGKQNPNEGWWDRFAAEFARRLAEKLNGRLELK